MVKKILDDMDRKELLALCREQRQIISELRSINMHHMVLLCRYLIQFPRAAWSSFSFDGIDDYDAEAFDRIRPFTVACWFDVYRDGSDRVGGTDGGGDE